MKYLGLGKTKYNSSICLLDNSFGSDSIELLLTERLTRKKNSGSWPSTALLKIKSNLDKEQLLIAENRDVMTPRELEDLQDKNFPFYDYLKKNDLDFFTSKYNSAIKFIPHHLAHAYAALGMSPFDKSLIIVMDGAGSMKNPSEFEECSVYLQDGVNLKLALSRNVEFIKSKNNPDHMLGNAIGATYEKISEFIFGSPHSSGKVMGLAPYGKALTFNDFILFLENLSWENSFLGKSKNDWEKYDKKYFENIAATVQLKLEDIYEQLINELRSLFPDYNNLILTGGCALNCTNNAKILYQKKFDQIYVTPFPGDESIGFGLAHYLKYKNDPQSWKRLSFENQSAYFGLSSSKATDLEIEREFSSNKYSIKKLTNVNEEAVNLLMNNEIIAWFQGRSESGPRALGNRSILSRPDISGLKLYLNKYIKFRENFRPYGCSVLYSKAFRYFEIPKNFNNPYMSYAIKVRSEYLETLKEVSHIDGTSRMQTVRRTQNEKFYDLIEAFGVKTNLYCLLNTSLNIMDEPIVETVSDVRRFMDLSPLKHLFIEDYYIQKLETSE